MCKRSSRESSTGDIPETLGSQAATTLRGVIKVLEKDCNVLLLDLTPKEGDNLKSVEKFCSGLLEKPKEHVFSRRIGYLSVKKQVKIAGSLFLSRKILRPDLSLDPNRVEKMCRDYFAKMSTPVNVPEDYITFLSKFVRNLFPKGWDKGIYRRKIIGHAPSSSRCRALCGASAVMRDLVVPVGHEKFMDQCMGGISPPSFYEPHVTFAVVPSGGKYRQVTTQMSQNEVLAPLHRSIYDHISKFPWLMRGEARGRKFNKFEKKEGEVFVSGDYESATDNLSMRCVETIVDEILDRSVEIPVYVKRLARASLKSILCPSSQLAPFCINPVVQRRGQLMGNYLSFPLLCIQNFAAFKYLVPADVPVKINGDDIVFRASPAVANEWMDGVKNLGFKLSRGKTLVSKNFFSLNSSFFVPWKRGVREVAVLRPKLVNDTVPSAGDFIRFIRNWRGLGRTLAGALWLRMRHRQILSLGRSVVEGLGIPADNSQIHNSGLTRWESFFRGSRSDLSVPSPVVQPFIRKNGPEEDTLRRWCFRPAEKGEIPLMKENFARFRAECFSSVWAPRNKDVVYFKKDEWWAREKSAGLTSAFFSWRRTIRKFKMFNTAVLKNPPLRQTYKRKDVFRRGWFLRTLDSEEVTKVFGPFKWFQKPFPDQPLWLLDLCIAADEFYEWS